MIEDATVGCVSCGEPISLAIDTTGGHEQTYVEDCPVCCRPQEVRVICRAGEVLSVSVASP